jgi:hypothetical protein
VLGFADVSAGKTWRTFSVATGDRVIQVAQPRQIRQRARRRCRAAQRACRCWPSR